MYATLGTIRAVYSVQEGWKTVRDDAEIQAHPSPFSSGKLLGWIAARHENLPLLSSSLVNLNYLSKYTSTYNF